MSSLALHIGVPCAITGTADLALIEQLLRSHPLPQEFAYQLRVYQILAKFLNTIVENSQEILNHSLIRIIDSEIDGLRERFSGCWIPQVEISSLTAKLLLYTTAIIRLPSDHISRNLLMRNTLSVTVRIIYIMNEGIAYSSPSFPAIHPQSTLPKNCYRTLVIATTFLLRFFVLNTQATAEEQELARNHVAIAQRFLAAGSKNAQDERAKGARLFEILSSQKPVDLDNSKLKVDDRMGASLFYDAVTKAQELRQRPTEVEEPLRWRVKLGVVETQEPAADISGQHFSSHDLSMAAFDTMNFELPQDLWGDGGLGMFDDIAPSYYAEQTNAGAGDTFTCQ